MSQFNNIIRSLPPVTKNLLMVNIFIWVVMMILPAGMCGRLMDVCALHYFEAPDFNPVQLFTYMFMHSTASLTHLLFNMFSLFMFGIVLERLLGSRRFLFYYLSCGVGAALIQEVVWSMTLERMIVDGLAQLNHTSKDAVMGYLARNPESLAMNYDFFTTVGASGAIYGVLLAFGMLFPNRPLYLMFIPVPIKAKWMIAGFVVIELLIGLSSANDGIAHFAHLGGMLIGFIMILFWKKKGVVNGPYY
ncbi:MAG: rhomboid family intramembrane serine protease [Paramuribaculum sp.]|nr:rhomboid family intramembrane serine protease [Paramuribaculum sp.]MDE6323450.1 rhomboid family intramembrane serine protease [Paramuribaculum sp.]